MTYQDDFTLPTELLEQVAEQGLDFLPELIRIVINTAMQVERQKHLGVGPYERSAERQGHANGFKPKTVSTRIAPITFDIPQVREGGFYPQALEKGLLFLSDVAGRLSLLPAEVDRERAVVLAELRSRGVSSIYISHRLEEVFAIADRVTVLHYGRVVADGRADQVRADPLVQEIYLGTARSRG